MILMTEYSNYCLKFFTCSRKSVLLIFVEFLIRWVVLMKKYI